MKINLIEAKNFKGSSFTTQLSPVTVIVGSNFVGKSSRIEATMLAMAGYLPGIEATASRIFERLASDKEMSVTAEFDKGSVTRRWKKGKGVESSAEFKGVPDGWACEPVSIDPNEFLGLSSKERIKFLFRRTSIAGQVSTPAIMALVKKQVEMTAETAEICLAKLKTFEGATAARLAGGYPQEALEQLNEETRQWKLRMEAQMRECEAGMTTIAQSQQTVNPEKAEVEYRKAVKALDEVRASHLEATELWRSSKEALEEAKNHGSRSEKVKELQRKLDEVNGSIQKLAEQLKDGPPNAGSIHRDYQQACIEADVAKRALSACQGREAQAVAKMDELDGMNCCPTCRASSKGWKDKVMETLREDVNEAVRASHAAELKANDTEAAREKAKALMTEFNRAAADYSAADAKLRWLRGQAETIRGDLAACRGGNRAIDLEALVKNEAKAQQAVQTTVEALASCEYAVAETRKVYDEAAGQKAREDMLKQSAARMQDTEIELAVAKGASKALTQLLADLTEKSVGGLMATMNTFCGDILPAPLEYEDGEIGMRRGKKFVSFKSFSGTEKALAACAVSLALASAGQARLAILDEMGRMDDKNKRAVLEHVVGMIKRGELDQALLVDVDGAAYPKKDDALVRVERL